MSLSDSASDFDASAAVESIPITPDAMARILEPRVRSNAKNNAKAAKGAAPKPSPRAETVPIIEEARATLPIKEIAPPIPAPGDEPPAISDAKTPDAKTPGGETPVVTKPSAPVLRAVEPQTVVSGAEKTEVMQNLAELRDLVLALQENQLSRDHAFDLLYEELSGYKNDFYLERLKPTLRALLFLLDSIDGFDREIDGYEERGAELTGELVKANLLHFRDQMTDVLTLCEVTPIEPANDQFNPKIQRAVEVVPVEAGQNNTVQRQIRGGWRLGDKMLRPADVVVGRAEGEKKR